MKVENYEVVDKIIHEPFSEFIKLMSPELFVCHLRKLHDRRLTLDNNCTCSVLTMDYGTSLYKLAKCGITKYCIKTIGIGTVSNFVSPSRELVSVNYATNFIHCELIRFS